MSLIQGLLLCIKSVPGQVFDYRKTPSNVSKGVINFFPLFAPPFVTSYFDLPGMNQIPKDLVCGAFMNILREMSFKYGYSIKRLDINLDGIDFYRRVMNDSYEGVNMFLLPMSNTFFEGIKDILDTYNSDSNDSFKFSRALGIESEGDLVCWKLPGQWSKFKFLSSFEPIVWYSLIATLVIFGAIKSLKERKSLRQLLNNCWKFFSSTFGHKGLDIEKLIIKNILSILWLSCMTIMLSGFSGVLLRFFMQPLPNMVIDSWDDLYERKDVKILAFHLSFMLRYIQEYEDKEEMAHAFAQRYVPFDELARDIIGEYAENYSDDMVKNWTAQDYGKLIYTGVHEQFLEVLKIMETGKYVMSAQKYQLQSGLLLYANLLGDNFHISESGGGTSPYFLYIHPNRFCPNLEEDLNHLTIQLIESGIYDHWLSQRVYDYSGELRAKLWRRDNSMDWDPIYFIKIVGVFNLWITGICIAVIVFAIHLFVTYFHLSVY